MKTRRRQGPHGGGFKNRTTHGGSAGSAVNMRAGRPCNGPCRRLPALAAVAALAVAGSAWADPVFNLIPRDVAAVIGIANLEAVNARLIEFGRRIDPAFKGIDLGEFERTLGLDAGTVDLTQPVYFIASRPDQLKALVSYRSLGDGDGDYPIVSFRPKDPASFLRPGKVGSGREHRRRGPFGVYYLLVREGVVFISDSSLPLKHLRRVQKAESLGTSLTNAMTDTLHTSDLFVHIPFDAWRDQLGPMMLFWTGFIKVSMLADTDPAQAPEAGAIADWAVRGVQACVDQTSSLNIGFSFDGKAFQLDHQVAFKPHGPVARYLADVQRSGFAPWAYLPDRPFFVAGSWDWRVPAEHSITLKLNRLCLAMDSVRKSLDGETLKKMEDYARDCAEATRGTQFMITSPTGKAGPMQFLGADVVNQPRETLTKYKFLQENASEMMSTFIYGAGAFGGKFTVQKKGHCTYHDMAFDTATLDDHARDELTAVYGQDVRFQETAVGDTHIAFTISEPGFGVCDMIEAIAAGRSLAGQQRVQAASQSLLAESHITLLVDAGRVIEAMPEMLARGLKGAKTVNLQKAREGRAARPMKSTIGPLVGWSCRVRENALDCRLAVAADDFEALLSHARTFMQQAQSTDMAGSAPAPPLVWND